MKACLSSLFPKRGIGRSPLTPTRSRREAGWMSRLRNAALRSRTWSHRISERPPHTLTSLSHFSTSAQAVSARIPRAPRSMRAIRYLGRENSVRSRARGHRSPVLKPLKLSAAFGRLSRLTRHTLPCSPITSFHASLPTGCVAPRSSSRSRECV